MVKAIGFIRGLSDSIAQVQDSAAQVSNVQEKDSSAGDKVDSAASAKDSVAAHGSAASSKLMDDDVSMAEAMMLLSKKASAAQSE